MYDQIFYLLFTNHIYYQSWNQSIPCSFIWFMLNIGSPSARLSIMRLCLTVIIALYISVSHFRKKPIRFVYICQCVVYTRTFKDADRFFSSQPFCTLRGGSETGFLVLMNKEADRTFSHSPLILFFSFALTLRRWWNCSISLPCSDFKQNSLS